MAWAIWLGKAAEATPLAERGTTLDRFEKKGHEMPRKTKIEGKAIARILDAQTRETVGYLYEWNNGAVDPKWKDDIVRDEKEVVYEYE